LLFVALVYTVLVSLLAARSAAARRALARRVPIVPAAFGMLLLANLALLGLASLLSPADKTHTHAVTEVAETGVAIIFLAVALDAARARAPGSVARTGGQAASASPDPVE